MNDNKIFFEKHNKHNSESQFIGIFIVLSCGILWGLSGIFNQLIFMNCDMTTKTLCGIRSILSGIILAIGRIVGETAALIYTAGTMAKVPSSLLGSGRTLAIHMYLLSTEALYLPQAYATAVVLLVLVIGINAFSNFVANRLTKGNV